MWKRVLFRFSFVVETLGLRIPAYYWATTQPGWFYSFPFIISVVTRDITGALDKWLGTWYFGFLGAPAEHLRMRGQTHLSLPVHGALRLHP